MYLNTPKEVTRAHLTGSILSLTGMDKDWDLPSLTRLGMQEMFGTAEVKGAATLACLIN